MAEDRMLLEALDAARNGERARAKELITRLLRSNQKNTDYWLGLSALVDTDKEKIYCLEKVLSLEPKNDIASRGLILLGAKAPPEDIRFVKPENEREFEIGEIFIEKLPETTKRPPMPKMRLALIAGLGFVVLAMFYIGVFGSPFTAQLGSFQSGFVSGPFGSANATATYLASPSPENFTPLPTLPGPTPLSMLLSQPYTPTPRYVNTPHPSTAAYRSAMNAFDQGNWEMAVEFLGQAIEIEPAKPDLHYHMGMALLNLEQYFDAKEAFVHATDFNPEFGPAYLGMALADLALNLESEIRRQLDSAVIYDPNMGIAYIQRGIYRLSRDNVEGALIDFRRAEERLPNSAILHLNFAKVFLALERFPEALESAQRSYQIDITILETYWALAQAHHALDQHREVIGPLQTYLTYEQDNARAWYILGQAYIAEGYYENAIEVLETALDLLPTLGEANYYRGLAYLELQDYDNALKYLENTSNNFPEWFEPNLAWGRAMFEDGQTSDGYFQINKSRAFAKTPHQKAVQLYWAAISLEALDEFEAALLRWEELLMLSTDVVQPEWEALARSRLTEAGIPLPSRTPPAPTPTPMPSPTPTPSPIPTFTATPSPSP